MSDQLNIAEFFAENVYNPDFTDEITADGEQIVATVRAAVDALLEDHARTGLDLSGWTPVLDLAVLVYPTLVVHGCNGGNTAHTRQSEFGETGRYWIDGIANPGTTAWCDTDSYTQYASKGTVPTELWAVDA